MKTKWTSLLVAGTVLTVLSSQAMAQPWGGGGRGQGFGRGQGMGGMGQGQGPMRQGMGPAGPQGGGGAWAGPGLGQFALGGQVCRRLGLTDDQIQKIRDIVEKARVRTREAIKDVLTEEQAKQLDQMRERAGRIGQAGRGPALQGGPAGRPFRQGRGQGAWMGPRGQGPAGPPFAGGPGARRGMGPQRGMNRPGPALEPPTSVQGVTPGRSWNRGVPPIEQMFDQADTNNDGALTKEEIQAFHERMGRGPGRGRP